jgi:hypothetical protein
MTSLVRRIRKLGAVMLDLFLSAVGCFVLMRCFHLVAAERESSRVVESIRATGVDEKPRAGIGAALFLLAYAMSEAPAVSRARRH